MLLRIFRGTSPGVIFLIAATLLAFWFSAFVNAVQASFSGDNDSAMPLYALLKMILGGNHLLETICSFVIVALIAFLLISFNSTSLFISERTFLPALIYILTIGIFPELRLLNAVLPATLFLLLSIKRIMDGYRKPGIAYNFFDAALLISTGSLFYANLIWFGLLVIIGIALLRTWNIREIALSVVGLITPYFITVGIYYVMGREVSSVLSGMVENIVSYTGSFVFLRLTIIALIFAGVMTAISTVYLIMHLNTKKIKTRQTFILLIWILIISAIVYAFTPSVSVEIIYLAGLPVSYILAHYYLSMKKRIVPEVVFTLYFLLVILLQIWSGR